MNTNFFNTFCGRIIANKIRKAYDIKYNEGLLLGNNKLGDRFEYEERFRTEEEVKRFIYRYLRELYFVKESISLSQYRTVKGQLFKDIDKGYNFMRKYYPELDDELCKYIATPVKEVVYVRKVTFPELVKMAIIDINLNKEK